MSESSSFILAFLLLPQLSRNTFSKCIYQGGQGKDILDFLLLACLPVLGMLLAFSTYLSFPLLAC